MRPFFSWRFGTVIPFFTTRIWLSHLKMLRLLPFASGTFLFSVRARFASAVFIRLGRCYTGHRRMAGIARVHGPRIHAKQFVDFALVAKAEVEIPRTVDIGGILRGCPV